MLFKNKISIIAKILGLIILLLVLAVFVAWLLQPQMPSDYSKSRHQYVSPSIDMDLVDSSLAMLQDVIKVMKLPSLSVAVSIGNELVWVNTFGYSDIKKGKYPGPDTRYRAGSVSKAITGLGAAVLVSEQLLHVDSSIYEYVPEFPVKLHDFSIRQLGAHTAGIRHYARPGKKGFKKEYFAKHYQSVKESLSIFQDDDLKYRPGHGFTYSTHGFTLLSLAMERAAGMDYISTMNKYLWNPLGMKNTAPDDITVPDSGRAIPYTRIAKRLFHIEGADPSYKWAGGGLLSTPSDLVTMGSAFATHQLIDSALTQDLFTPRPLADGSPNPQNYALGWRNARSSEMLGTADTLAVRHHGGSSPGGSSFILVLPEAEISVAAMTNLSIRDPWPLRTTLFKIAGLFATVKE